MKEKTSILLRRFLKSELISGSFFLFIGSTVGNILAFIFNVFLVRNLSYGQYAEYSALVSLITMTIIPAQAFLPTIVQFSGKYFAKKDTQKAAQLFKEFSKKAGLLAVALFFVFVLVSIPVGKFLHIVNFYEIILVGGTVAAVYLGITNTAFLQSLLHFPFIALTMTLGGVIKLATGIGFYLAGFGLMGIFWGYFLSFFLPFLLTFFPLRFLFATHTKKEKPVAMNEVIQYGLPAAIAIFSLSSFTSTDILLVKHFLPAADAALYSGLSLIGRIIFYFTAPIPMVMFPLVVKRFHNGEKFHNLLYLSFLLVLLPSFSITAFYFLFPKIAISIFLGSKYFAVAPYLGWFGIYLCIFSLINVLVNFFLSLKKTYVSWVIAIGALMQAIGIWLFHGHIGEIIGISLTLSSLLFCALLLYYMNEYVAKKKQKK